MTKPRAKRSEVLSALAELGLEWRGPNERLTRYESLTGRTYGNIFTPDGKLMSGPVSLPADDLDAPCDQNNRSLRWWGDYLGSVVYRMHFGELPKNHNFNFGVEDEELQL